MAQVIERLVAHRREQVGRDVRIFGQRTAPLPVIDQRVHEEVLRNGAIPDERVGEARKGLPVLFEKNSKKTAIPIFRTVHTTKITFFSFDVTFFSGLQPSPDKRLGTESEPPLRQLRRSTRPTRWNAPATETNIFVSEPASYYLCERFR